MDPRDVIVDCHCMRCTAGFLPPARIRAITQQKHLARDQSDAELAYSLGQPPTTTLLAAIQKNQTVAASPPSSPSPAAAAASSPVAPAFDTNDDILIFDDHGLDEFQLPDQTSSSPHHISQSSAEEEEQEDFGREVDAESDHEDDGLSSVDGLDEDDLFGISDGEDGIHVAIWDEDAENDDSSQRSADEEREGDPRATSRHGQDLLEQLLDGYHPGSRPRRPPNRHSSAHRVRERMTRSQLASLRHVVTCIRTNATDKQSEAFARNVERQDPAIKILGKKGAVSLLKRIVRPGERQWDMCPHSCMAFVGAHADLDHCTAIRDGRRCGEARRDARGKARKQFTTFSVLSRVRARFACGKAFDYLHQQGSAATETWGTMDHVMRDWSHGSTYQAMRAEGFFDEHRNDAFMLSTDGAQMVEKRKSNGWIVLLSSFNTPILKRFKHGDSFIASIIPGPNNPIDLDSFLFPILQELARATLGYWIWDGARQEWILWRAWPVAAAADQQGQNKLKLESHDRSNWVLRM